MGLPKELHQAVDQGNVTEILHLLAQQSPPTQQTFANRYARVMALEGHLTIFKYLQSKDISLEATDEVGAGVLHYAVYGGKLELLEYLCQRGADLHSKDEVGTTLLHAAAIYGELSLVKYLCEHGLAVNATNSRGQTPMHLVLILGLVKMRIHPEFNTIGYQRLLDYFEGQGANLEAADQEGRTVRELLARWQEQQAAPRMWLSKGAARTT